MSRICLAAFCLSCYKWFLCSLHLTVWSNSRYYFSLFGSWKRQLLHFTLHLFSHVWNAREVAPGKNVTMVDFPNKLCSIRLQTTETVMLVKLTRTIAKYYVDLYMYTCVIEKVF